MAIPLLNLKHLSTIFMKVPSVGVWVNKNPIILEEVPLFAQVMVHFVPAACAAFITCVKGSYNYVHGVSDSGFRVWPCEKWGLGLRI